MSTWYSTCISFYSKCSRPLEEFKQKLDSIYSGEATLPNDYGKGWLGDIANTFYPSLGSDKIDSHGTYTVSENVECREEWFFFHMWTTTARGIKIGLFYKLISDFYPDIKIAYISDSSVHIIWDEDNLFYPFKYYMDICYPSKSGEISYIDTHEFASIEEIYLEFDQDCNLGLAYILHRSFLKRKTLNLPRATTLMAGSIFYMNLPIRGIYPIRTNLCKRETSPAFLSNISLF